MRDVAQTTPIQVFTPRNSTGFAGSRAFPDAVDALRCQFVNPEAGYQQDEVVVYGDGFGDAEMVTADPLLTLAQNFEQLSLPGCTNANAAWRLGRYHLAVVRCRLNLSDDHRDGAVPEFTEDEEVSNADPGCLA